VTRTRSIGATTDSEWELAAGPHAQKQWPQWLVGGLCVILVIAAGIGDYLTGPDIQFTSLYLVPVGLAAWAAGRGLGALVSGLSAIAYYLADVLTRQSPMSVYPRLWNTAVEFLVFLTLSLLIASVRDYLARERAALSKAENAVGRLRAVQLVTDTALAHLQPEELLVELLKRIRAILATDTATILLCEPQGTHLTVRASDGLIEHPDLRIPVGQGIAGRIAAARTVLAFEDLAVEEVWSPQLKQSVRSLLGVPLLVEGQLIGVLHVGSGSPRHFTDDEAQILQLVADRVALATDRSRLFHEVTESRERTRALSRRLVEAQETERREIARELHDEIGQVLTAVKICIGKLADREGEPARAPLQEVLDGVDRAIEQVRSMSLDLRPSLLDDLGLVEAVRWYAHRAARETSMKLSLEAGGLAERLPSEIETACFRVVQESLTNVLRHAHAGQVFLSLHRQGSRLEVTVRDDGVGFNLELARGRSATGSCMGLAGMEERVSLVGGQFAVVSSVGTGTEIRASFPIEGPQDRELEPILGQRS
jgi:signal transduction histidine kinase